MSTAPRVSCRDAATLEAGRSPAGWIDADPEPFELPAQLERMIGVVLHGVLTADAADPGA